MPRPIRSVCGYPWQQLQIDLTGEVVPCCFWTTYANTGKALGNVNVQSIDEIWNGPAYQELRRRNASGDLDGHPCKDCLAYRWSSGLQPGFEMPGPFRAEAGHCFGWRLPPEVVEAEGPLEVLEDGVPISRLTATMDEVRALGEGRYLLLGETLAFSASDNSDVLLNGRTYVARRGDATATLERMSDDSAASRNLLAAYAAYRAGQPHAQHQPTMVTLISTADCNIDCPHCSQNHQRPIGVQLRAEVVPDVLSKVPYLHAFTWQGGEPFLIKRFRDFVAEFDPASNPHLVFGFTSNGTMITVAELEKLKKFPRLNASISMDSFVKETFERLRRGARFETVLRNALRCFQLHDTVRRTFTVGMVACKTNVAELATNLELAIGHEIGVNISPILNVPVTEQLNAFEDFEEQTRGWGEAIARAKEIAARAVREGRRAARRVDPTAMIEEVERAFHEAQRRYAWTRSLRVQLRDPAGGVRGMVRPGLVVVTPRCPVPAAYRETPGGAGEYVLHLPALEVVPGDEVLVHLYYDLDNPLATCGGASFTVPGLGLPLPRVEVTPRRVSLPRPPKNVTRANYGETAPDGLILGDPEEMVSAYERVLVTAAEGGTSPRELRERVRAAFRTRILEPALEQLRAISARGQGGRG